MADNRTTNHMTNRREQREDTRRQRQVAAMSADQLELALTEVEGEVGDYLHDGPPGWQPNEEIPVGYAAVNKDIDHMQWDGRTLPQILNLQKALRMGKLSEEQSGRLREVESRLEELTPFLEKEGFALPGNPGAHPLSPPSG